MVTRDVMEHGGFYDESPLDPKTGKLKHLRLTLHSSSKLFNDASGPGTCAGHADTTAFLGDMLRGSYTQAHARDRKVGSCTNIKAHPPMRSSTSYMCKSKNRLSSMSRGRLWNAQLGAHFSSIFFQLEVLCSQTGRCLSPLNHLPLFIWFSQVIPAIVNNLDYNACSKWMANMDLFSAKTQGKVPG